jgi:hypothetical protein
MKRTWGIFLMSKFSIIPVCPGSTSSSLLAFKRVSIMDSQCMLPPELPLVRAGLGFRRSKDIVRGTKANRFRYLDPIMATLMKDPVILPTSKQVIDRSTIRSHLLSDPHDPFNRSPLKIEDVIDDTALKEKIIAWRAEMMQKAKAARGDDNAMDTTDG